MGPSNAKPNQEIPESMESKMFNIMFNFIMMSKTFAKGVLESAKNENTSINELTNVI